MPSPSDSPVSRSPARRRWFIPLTVLGAPLLFLALLEGLLRLVGFGHPTDYFLPEPGGSWRTNPQFSRRFFPAGLARAPDNFRLSAKAVGVTRIFVIGSSAAQGVPVREYGFARLLEVMLREAYPERRWEVVNLSMTAVNSHVQRLAAQEVADHQPDVFLLYLGNNEVVGPYGPGSVLSSFRPSLGLIRLGLRVRATRTGQALEQILAALRPPAALPSKWQGMEMFADRQVRADDPRLDRMAAHFRANLRDILAAAQRSGAACLVGTLAANLADCPPFANPAPPPPADSPAAAARTALLADLAAGRWAQAEAAAAALLEQTPEDAETHYLRGRALLGLGRPGEARAALWRARDLDTLRFRADPRINRALREGVAQSASTGARVALVDAEAALGAGPEGDGPVAGSDLFFEHVHFTWEGNYRLAELYFRALPAVLPDLPAAEPPDRGTCAARLAYGDLGRSLQLGHILQMLARPPFTGQIGHAERRQALQAEFTALEARLRAGGLANAAESLRAASTRWPEDPWLKVRAGLLALETAPPAEARALLQEAFAALPENDETNWILGRTYLTENRLAEAEDRFRQAVRRNPFHLQAWLDLGLVLAQRQNFPSAEALYERLAERFPDQPEIPFAHGLLRQHTGQPETAESLFRQVLRLAPGHARARAALVDWLQRRNRTEEALELDRELLRRDPDLPEPHAALAQAAAGRGDWAAALAHSQRLCELRPDDPEARYRLVAGLLQTSDVPGAIAQLEILAARHPDLALPRNDLAWLLATRPEPGLRDPPRALALATAVVAQTGDHLPQARGTLAAALAANGRFAEAIAEIDRALALAEQAGDTALVEILRANRARFAAGQDLRE